MCGMEKEENFLKTFTRYSVYPQKKEDEKMNLFIQHLERFQKEAFPPLFLFWEGGGKEGRGKLVKYIYFLCNKSSATKKK
jgi:hypothetical protein